MKNRGIPPYTALCNHHFRFYFSNPERIEFRNSVEEKQFQAAKKVISSLSQQELLLLKEIIIPRGDGSIGIDNGYINVNVRDYCCITRETPSDVYKLLRFVTKQLALELGYVGEMGGVSMKLSQRNMNRGDINYEIYGEFICEIEQEFYCIPVSIKKGKQIILCPHCHELHRHGVGFGRRAAHCEGAYKQSSLGYTIVPSFDTQCITKYKLKKELGGI